MSYSEKEDELSNTNTMKRSKIISIACYTGVPLICTCWLGCSGKTIIAATALGGLYGGLKQFKNVKTDVRTVKSTENSASASASVSVSDQNNSIVEGAESIIWTGAKVYLLVTFAVPVIMIGTVGLPALGCSI